jgi:hypothetical protein
MSSASQGGVELEHRDGKDQDQRLVCKQATMEIGGKTKATVALGELMHRRSKA